MLCCAIPQCLLNVCYAVVQRTICATAGTVRSCSCTNGPFPRFVSVAPVRICASDSFGQSFAQRDEFFTFFSNPKNALHLGVTGWKSFHCRPKLMRQLLERFPNTNAGVHVPHAVGAPTTRCVLEKVGERKVSFG